MTVARTIVYCSFDGRYSDNPRALYEGSAHGTTGDRHVWLCHPDHRGGFPSGTATVAYGSAEASRVLGEADLIVANTHVEMDWSKKPGAVYLQTWHGTPLKRVHHDVFWAPPGRLARLDGDVARWDYLVSPNPVSTPRLRSAFGFTKEVLETGYPRNDLLVSPRSELVRARVRATLGLSDETTAVLYAPTWRDDEYFAEGAPQAGLALDIDAFVSELGHTHTLMPRVHYLMTDRLPPMKRPGVADVSRYPDMQELYLAADVLITDYSSSMFDFAVTGKPMIFYTYDLATYRDSLRGFYFDLEPLAPGPLLSAGAEVLAALGHLPEVQNRYADAYDAFRRTFCTLDDGRATQRLARLMASKAGTARELADTSD
ncbi:MAG TPA: CDP-glycerol glycerophosphotransferase family protein [Propionibacteriaceae bacterium]|nr:CDP-glycerol glycerophosphotransferase family protein [Propionibacteriaceae bacterium]